MHEQVDERHHRFWMLVEEIDDRTPLRLEVAGNHVLGCLLAEPDEEGVVGHGASTGSRVWLLLIAPCLQRQHVIAPTGRRTLA